MESENIQNNKKTSLGTYIFRVVVGYALASCMHYEKVIREFEKVNESIENVKINMDEHHKTEQQRMRYLQDLYRQIKPEAKSSGLEQKAEAELPGRK